MAQLTRLELVVYNFICNYWTDNSYSPSFRDIAEGCHISVPVAHRYVGKIFEKGYIGVHPNKARSIVVKDLKNNNIL